MRIFGVNVGELNHVSIFVLSTAWKNVGMITVHKSLRRDGQMQKGVKKKTKRKKTRKNNNNKNEIIEQRKSRRVRRRER